MWGTYHIFGNVVDASTSSSVQSSTMGRTLEVFKACNVLIFDVNCLFVVNLVVI